MAALKIAFWICAFLVFYTYLGYGMLLWLLVRLKRIVRGKAERKALPTDEAELPEVTFMICAYNEQDVVDMKMENTLQLDYPHDKLHIMWVTDGSTDQTNERLARYADVEVVFSPERRGKTAALNHGISMVRSEITMMTDANTIVNREAVREIVRCFQDPRVACVAGEKRVMARHEGQAAAEGEGLYWKYESALKRMDSELYSAMGAAGELNAIRTRFYKPMPETALLDDFVMSMRMVDQGYKIAYTSDAYAMEYGSADLTEESKRKRRIAAGGLQSPECCAGHDESRHHLYRHLDTSGAVLPRSPRLLDIRKTGVQKQAALCALLLPLHEPQRLPRHEVSLHPQHLWSVGKSQARIVILITNITPRYTFL